MESLELKDFLREVGNSVHSMNTIAVALSLLPVDSNKIPDGLDISWDPKDIEYSKIMSRNYAERSSYVYAAENLFEYIENISKNPFWNYPNMNFEGEDKKAIKVYKFLKATPGITETMAILVELLCHWRNRIVHLNISNAGLSSNKKDHLKDERNNIFSNFHHFDILEALDNFNAKKITLKDVSTLITISIKSVRQIDEYFLAGIANKNVNSLKQYFEKDKNFQRIITQTQSEKKVRQLKHWININYPYLSAEKYEDIFHEINKTSP